MAKRGPGRPARVAESRDADTRTNDRRDMPVSRHVGKLFVPTEEIPPGYTYSWIAVEQLQVPDFSRADEQSAKGWTPVPRNRHPRYRNGGSLIPGRAETDPYAQFIKVGGLLLCERPSGQVLEDKRAQQNATNEQIRSISRWRNGEGTDPLMPRIDESSGVEYDHRAAFKKD